MFTSCMVWNEIELDCKRKPLIVSVDITRKYGESDRTFKEVSYGHVKR